MPCNSDYLEADSYERSISQVACLLDELNGKKKINPNHWEGYHPDVYNKCSKRKGDELVARLCDKLKQVDVTKYSLEMQMWWRDHQEADRQRIKEEARQRKKQRIDAAVEKYRQQLLKNEGLK